VTWLGASIPAFLAAFALYALTAPLVLGLTARARTRGRVAAEYVQACRTDDVPEGTAKVVDLGNLKLVVARSGDEYFAFGRRCPHMGGCLEKGTIRGTVVTCPWHKARFDMADGGWVRWVQRPFWRRMLSSLYPYALKHDIASYDVKVDGDQVLVRGRDGREAESDVEASERAAEKVGVS
jgi:nitrite reductase/ring-hydroxylating ferredoxin subunit